MSHRFNAVTITLIYAAFAAAWIVASGTVLFIATPDLVLYGRIEMVKGLVFVTITSGLLYLLLQTRQEIISTPAFIPIDGFLGGKRWQLGLMIAILALTVPLIAFVVFALNAKNIEQNTIDDLHRVAEFKAKQLEGWLLERRKDAEALAGSKSFIKHVIEIQRGENTFAHEAVRDQLVFLQNSPGFDSIELLDPHGKALITVGESFESGEVGATLVRKAVTTGNVQGGDLYRDAVGRPSLSFAVPLIAKSEQDPVGAVLLHANPAVFLFPQLQIWPVIQNSGETLLVRREGEKALYLNELRYREGAAMALYTPLENKRLPAAVALREGGIGTMVGMDYRNNQSVLAVWRPVYGSDWHLITKLDRDEVLKPVWTAASWTAFVTLLGVTLVVTAILLLIRQQRMTQQLAFAAQTDRLLKHFYDLPFIGMAIVPLEKKSWLKFNDRFCTMFGYAREEMAVINWVDLTHPEDRGKDRFELDRMLSGESEGYVMDKRYLRKDGSVFFGSVDVKCVRKPEGEVDYFVITVEDITGRKDSEQALRESEEKLRQILEHSTQLFYSHTVEGQFIYVSPNIDKYFDYDATEPLPNWMNFLTDNPINAQGIEATRQAIETGKTQPPYQLELKSKLGRIVWAEVHESPVVVNGKTIAIVGALTDITERKNEEMRQSSEEERLLCQRNALIEFTVGSVPNEELINTVRRILEIDAKTLVVERVSVWRYNQDRSAIQCMDLYELGADRHTASMELSAAVNPNYFRALTEVDVIASEDAQHDERTCEFAEHYLRPMGITSMLDVPIHLGGIETGVLCHEHIGPKRRWTADEESFAVAVANLISLALERSERKRSEQAIERALQRLNEAQRIGQIGDWEWHIASHEITWSPQVFNILGRDPVYGPPGSFEENARLFDKASRVFMAKKINRAIATGETQECELLAKRPDGEAVHVHAVAVPRKDESGKVVGLHGTVQDISARKRVEQALFSRAYQQVLVATLGRFALANDDLDRVISEAASTVAKGLGVKYSKVMLLNTDLGGFVLEAGVGWQPDWIGRCIGDMTERSQTGYVTTLREPVIVDDFHAERRFTPSEMLRKHSIVSGIYVPIGGTTRPLGVLGAYARVMRKFSTDDIGFLQSLSNTLSTAIERANAHKRLAYIAQHDALTDLPNRLLFTDRLNMALAQAKRAGRGLAMMFIDLDRFKNVNDVFGHETGDKVLREVASRITGCVRATDTVSRQGGDEFLVILPEIDTKLHAVRVAQKLVTTLMMPITLDGIEVVLGGSIGIACFPEHGHDAKTLLRNADAAMYVAKERGRNGYQIYSAEMNARAHERLTLAGDLRRAIEREQLFVAYQPQIDLGTDAVIGLEALVRWSHPGYGLVLPAQFIPLAEENGLIDSIGAWVLETACRQHACWLAMGLIAGTMSVNVSARQFRQSNFVEVVTGALTKSGLQPSFLELEVTEGVVMQGIDEVLEKLNSLNRLGIKLAIDDFGTGYSSLSYLKQFPIYRLKIDQSFIRNLPGDLESAAIVKAVISLGHSLGLNVLGEGIETKAQEAYLRLFGCDAGQGYMYSKPITAEECTEYLQRHAQLLETEA